MQKMLQNTIALIQSLPQKLRRNTGNKKYLAEIDGLRFLAIFPVLLQHLSERMIRNFSGTFATPIEQDQFAFAISRGTIGVFIFFAISGFILTLPFAKHFLDNKPKIAYKDYLWKRITRLEPPFIIWMSFFALLLLIKGTYGFEELLPHFLSSIFYSHNLIYGEYSIINPVAWSLEIEIQFYLIAPILVSLFYTIKNTKIRRCVTIGLLLGFLTLQHHWGWMLFPYKATLLGQLQHFLVGMLVADFYLLEWRKTNIKNWLWDGLALVSFLIMMYTWTEEYVKSIVFAIALVLLLTSAFKGKIFPFLLKNSWISAIGGMCYTIYLIHLPLMELQMQLTGNWTFTNIFWVNLFIQVAIGLPIILGLSAGFFLLIEKPFMTNDIFQKIKGYATHWKLSKIATTSNERLFSLTKTKYFWIFLLLMNLFVNTLSGQTEMIYNDENTIELEIPSILPLDTFIQAALQFSPTLKVQDKWIEIKAKEQDLKKKDLLEKISIGGSALFGSGTIYNSWTNGENPSDLTSFNRNVGYNGGINIQFTVGDIVKGKEKRQLSQLELEKALLERQPMELQIREEVIRRYDDLLYCTTMIRMKANNLEAMRLSLEAAEPFFKAGNLAVTEYSTILSKKIKAEEELETAKARTIHCWRSLKEVCGMR